MALQPQIILQGILPDMTSAIGRGQQVAAQGQEIQHKNALNALYKDQGPGIIAGDQNALNALSRHDPMAAVGIQVNQSNLDMRKREFGLKMDIFKRDASETQRKKAAAQFEQGIAQGVRFHQAGDLAGLNAHLQSLGEQPVSSLDEFVPLAAMYEDAAAALKTSNDLSKENEPASFTALKLRADAAGLKPGTPEYATFMATAGKEADGLRISVDANGQLTVEQGSAVGGGKPPKTTEGEKSSAGFLSRMRNAEQTLSNLSEQTRSITSLLVGGSNFESLVLSEDQQMVLQAQRDWVRAKLRKESGAVIGDDEMAEEVRTYFPLPGDGPATVEQKRLARNEAVRQFEIMSGNALSQAPAAPPATTQQPAAATTATQTPVATTPPTTAPQQPVTAAPAQQPAQPQAMTPAQADAVFAPMSKEEVLSMDISKMTIEEIDAWNRRLDALEGGK